MNSAQPSPTASTERAFRAGLVCLIVATGACVLLALDHLGTLRAPGCGLEGGCAELTRGRFGVLPWVRWPVAYFGLAWFGALLAAWIAARGALGASLTACARLGALGSLVFLCLMLVARAFCPWCACVHVANLAFAAFVAHGKRAARTAPRVWISGAAAFVALTLFVVVLDARSSENAQALAEDERSQSQARILSGAGAQAQVFTGRWRTGPVDAQARVVVFTDYQCPDCKRVEGELEAELGDARSVSLSVKHFPMCRACNPAAADMHPNACWAARAAEAAGILGGDDGFWRMHRWLFARGGAFTDAELAAALPALGFDAAEFTRTLQSPQTLERVRADVDEGLALGLMRTPLVYVNGVELRGWDAPGAIARTLRAVEENTVNASRAGDRPVDARTKALDDWRLSECVVLPPDESAHLTGNLSAKVLVVVFGDLLEPNTAELDLAARELVLSRNDAIYSFRAFPLNKACNVKLERTFDTRSCLAVLGAEAAYLLGGDDGYWTMHEWIAQSGKAFDDARLTQQALAMGFDRDAFWQATGIGEVQLRMADDVAAANDLGLTEVPLLYVDGRRVPRWKVNGESLLAPILDAAVAEQ